jgi:actin-related protein
MDFYHRKYSMFVISPVCHARTHIRLQLDPTDTSLMITEPYMNLPNVQEIYDQFVFEEYGFRSYYRCSG